MADRMNPAFSTEVHWKHADNSVSHLRSGDGCMCEYGCMARQYLPLSFSTLLLKTRSLTEPSSLAGSQLQGPFCLLLSGYRHTRHVWHLLTWALVFNLRFSYLPRKVFTLGLSPQPQCSLCPSWDRHLLMVPLCARGWGECSYHPDMGWRYICHGWAVCN